MFPVKIIGAPQAVDRNIKIKANDVEASWAIPEETPVAFVYNRRNYAVMLASPQDLIDYAVGFSVTERVISTPPDIQELEIVHSDRGVDFRFRITDALLEKLDVVQRRRNIAGNAGCGLCGLENADALFAALPEVAATKNILDPAAVSRAFGNMTEDQPLNQRTRSVHAAAWASLDGAIRLLREDVGRHNALDKLLGALILNNEDMKNGFVVMSSRLSYELVEKAARCGATAIASISGPTGFALRKAAEANMALYARGADGAVELIG